MIFVRKIAVVLVVVFGVATAAWAQRMQQPPQIPGFAFNPVVGSGAQYEINTKNQQKMSWAYVIVGKESVDGADGVWQEMRMDVPKQGEMVMKQLIVMREGGIPDIKKMIMQSAGQPPMEMPMGMMGGMMKMGKQAGEGKEPVKPEKVGTESVTVPAGTFLCDHYRTTSEKITADTWISTKVAPYGLVKMTSADTTMVLLKVLENETSHIKGQPQKIEMPHF